MRRSHAKQKPGGCPPGLSIPASKIVVSKQDCIAKLLAESFSAADRYFAAVLLMVFSNGL